MKKEIFENAMTDVKDEYILEAAEKKETGRKKAKWKVLPAIAAAAVCLIISVNAIAPVDLGFYLKAVFGDSYEMLSDTISMPDNVAFKASDNSISLDLKGIVGDRQVVTVFVDLTLSADIEIPEGLGKAEEFALFDMKLQPTGMPWEKHIGSYGVTTGLIDKTENEDGSTTFSYVLKLKSVDGVNGGKYIASCTEMTYYDAESDKEVAVLEGEWNLAFSLNYKDISETVQLSIHDNMRTVTETYENGELEYEYGEAPVEIYEAVMSPLSLGIYWKSENEYKDAFLGGIPDDIVVSMADGSVIVKKNYCESEEREIDPIYITGVSKGGGCDGHGEPYMGYMILTFDAPLDTENVRSVTCGGIEIPLA